MVARGPLRWADRAVAQLGSALRSGRRGRRFKSCQPDQCRARIFARGSGPCLRVLPFRRRPRGTLRAWPTGTPATTSRRWSCPSSGCGGARRPLRAAPPRTADVEAAAVEDTAVLPRRRRLLGSPRSRSRHPCSSTRSSRSRPRTSRPAPVAVDDDAARARGGRRPVLRPAARVALSRPERHGRCRAHRPGGRPRPGRRPRPGPACGCCEAVQGTSSCGGSRLPAAGR